MLPSNERLPSPLEALTIERLGGRTSLVERVVSVSTVRIVLLQNNPNRLSWQILNEGSSDISFSTDATITGLSGWLLQASGGIAEMVYYDDGEVVGHQVWAITRNIATNVRVREVVRI